METTGGLVLQVAQVIRSTMRTHKTIQHCRSFIQNHRSRFSPRVASFNLYKSKKKGKLCAVVTKAKICLA